MSDPVADKVIALVASVKHIPVEKVSPDSSLADLGFDSLDTISLLFELESGFQISIPDEETKKIRFVHEIVAGVRTLLERGSQAPAVPGASPAGSPATE